MFIPALESAVQSFSSLPGIGRRSALRIVMHLLKSEEFVVSQLAESMRRLKEEVRFCAECGSLAEAELCNICNDPKRDRTMICVVEEPGDVYSIEKTAEFRGIYHVLMGAISPLDGIGVEDLRIRELDERLKTGNFLEVLVATNPTIEGDATANFLSDRYETTGKTITRISHGLQTGGTIEFSDQSALARSIRNRQSLR